MRLDKYLSNMGIDTRSNCKKIIKKGRVKINDSIEKDPAFSVDENTIVYLDDQKVEFKKHIYLMLNKPSGCITATKDENKETVMKYIHERRNDQLFPVGRLDRDTEGLLLLTNDGELAHALLSPKRHIDKTYFAKIDGRVTTDDVEAFRKGIQLKDFTTMPAKLEIIESNNISKVKVTIQEGKYHQVKRMFHAVKKEVIYLKRISMGSLELDESLACGQYRELNKKEIEDLKKTIDKGI